jgi:hypothetical protein
LIKKVGGVRASKSFSIIELLLVCAIVGIGAAVYAPRLSFVRQYKIQRELDVFEALFEYLCNRAMATGSEHRLIFLLDEHSYRYGVLGDMQSACKLCSGVEYGFVAGALGPPANPTTPLKRASTFGDGKDNFFVDFFPNGKISSGSLYLKVREGDIGVALTCAITQVSYVRKYVYIKHQWKRIND